MVGRGIFFWHGLFSGAMLVSGSVCFLTARSTGIRTTASITIGTGTLARACGIRSGLGSRQWLSTERHEWIQQQSAILKKSIYKYVYTVYISFSIYIYILYIYIHIEYKIYKGASWCFRISVSSSLMALPFSSDSLFQATVLRPT